jgi:hypothetical protein
MKRAERRHKSAMARKRREFLVLYWKTSPRPWWADKIWKYRNNPRYSMYTTPSNWTNLNMIRPARRESKALCQLVEKGAESENMNWPNYKKPHIYFW